MHAAGVRCVDCHDPHSGKRILPGNALCMRCHTQGGFPNAPTIVPAMHTFHMPESTGSQCVNCHMPQTTYMQRHPRHDHGFTIPDPLLTQQFNIPNACNKCHQDKDTAWSLAATEKWYGDKMNRRTRQRATLMAKARRGDDDARDGLIAWLQTDDTPYWKSSASLLLDRWTGSEDVRNALKSQLAHAHPMVRESAVRSLEAGMEADPSAVRAALEPMLEDPVRNVRVAAAWALRDHVSLESTAGKELLHSLDLNADQPSGQMQLGQFNYARGNLPKAVEHMRRAIAWDPNSPPFHHDLAMIESIAGDTQSSIASLQEAIRLNPNEPEYRYKLGLAFSEVGKMDKAIETLREAVRLAPTYGRAWYNLGLALNQQGKTEEALAAFTDGARGSPTDPSIPYAKATILARLGRIDEAKQEVFKALNNAPGMPEALQLREALSRPQQ
jgi:tetratricopeptide (TPR) repeat protein